MLLLQADGLSKKIGHIIPVYSKIKHIERRLCPKGMPAAQNHGFCNGSRPVCLQADGTGARLSKKEHNKLLSLNNLDFKSLSIR